MKTTSKFKTLGLALAIIMLSFACSQEETRNETNTEVDEAQADVDEADNEVNRGYEDFRAWVTTNTERSEALTADEYREMRTEYNRRSSELEAESNNWDEETRREWEETKADWNDFENRVQERLGKIDGVDVDVEVDRN